MPPVRFVSPSFTLGCATANDSKPAIQCGVASASREPAMGRRNSGDTLRAQDCARRSPRQELERTPSVSRGFRGCCGSDAFLANGVSASSAFSVCVSYSSIILYRVVQLRNTLVLVAFVSGIGDTSHCAVWRLLRRLETSP